MMEKVHKQSLYLSILPYIYNVLRVYDHVHREAVKFLNEKMWVMKISCTYLFHLHMTKAAGLT